MGRLFWKLFFSFWIALLSVAAGVGAIVWLHKPDSPNINSAPSFPSRPESTTMKTGAAILNFSGPEALKVMLSSITGTNKPTLLYAIDPNGLEILGRPVLESSIATAEKLAEDDANNNSVQRITLDNGSRWLLFVPSEIDSKPPKKKFSSSGSPSPGGKAPPPKKRPFRFSPWMEPWVLWTSGLIASIFFSALLAWYLVAPVRHLRRAFSAAESGDLDIRVQPLIGQRRDEIADLGRAYDNMADKLKEVISVQKALFHDVSHELRSPLARLHAATGLMKQNPDTIPVAIERIEREVERINLLVGEILILARLDSDVISNHSSQIDLIELVDEIISNARFEAESTDCQVDYIANSDRVFIHGNFELISRAVDNIVRNAIKYTASASVITVQTDFDVQQNSFRLLVIDQGQGIPADEINLIFEPFYRSNDSRSNHQGYGLGLAIARGAIEKHGGSITAANLLEGGLCITVTLPATTA